jgi:hypothetical protein
VRPIRLAVVAAVLAGAAACTSSPPPAPGSPSSPATGTPPTGTPPAAPSATTCGWDEEAGTDAPSYRGMTVVAAKDRAASEGFTVRARGADGVCFGGTDDLRSDRVNVYSERGVVVWARLY